MKSPSVPCVWDTACVAGSSGPDCLASHSCCGNVFGFGCRHTQAAIAPSGLTMYSKNPSLHTMHRYPQASSQAQPQIRSSHGECPQDAGARLLHRRHARARVRLLEGEKGVSIYCVGVIRRSAVLCGGARWLAAAGDGRPFPAHALLSMLCHTHRQMPRP